MKESAITLKKNELVYDVEYMLHKLSRTGGESESSIWEIGISDADHDYLDRLFTSAMSNVRNELSWCTAYGHHPFVSDGLQGSPGDYDIVLHIDDGWRGDMQALCSAIHDYVVHYAVYQQLLASAPLLAPSFAALAESDLNKAYSIARSNLDFILGRPRKT